MVETHRDYVKEELERFLKEKEGEIKSVLDVGCGGLYFKEYFESKGIKWSGLDSKYSAGCTKLKMENIYLFPNFSKFDLIFCCHSFEHCENPIQTLRGFRGILNKDGYLFIATPFPNVHHILDADIDHIFCMSDIQMYRLLKYTNYQSYSSSIQKEYKGKNLEENNFNIISIARK